ncbi:hypothetical protein BpHYR1_035222 [Brachionus plicatilis]|uniref:Uncharacterized protein n=1 Tax=Brachionus plicatilis TaxID=10195 RepID=A0A3M7T9N9_BRAPC|nr:hypothetical protein BpHYR1_035222 [Brachionus plicatilis]
MASGMCWPLSSPFCSNWPYSAKDWASCSEMVASANFTFGARLDHIIDQEKKFIFEYGTTLVVLEFEVVQRMKKFNQPIFYSLDDRIVLLAVCVNNALVRPDQIVLNGFSKLINLFALGVHNFHGLLYQIFIELIADAERNFAAAVLRFGDTECDLSNLLGPVSTLDCLSRDCAGDSVGPQSEARSPWFESVIVVFKYPLS